MSWIFSFLLACYVLVRLALRVRGQFRWLAVRDTLPVPPPAVDPPKHLPPALARLFVDSRALRAELVEARRVLTAVEIKDPDAPLGRVRDARYRRTLMESWTRLGAWLRDFEALGEAELGALEDMHLGAEGIASLKNSLRGRWREVSRARALDPFALADLEGVVRTFERIEAELEGIELRLGRFGEHPYRDRHADAGLGAAGC